MTATTRTTDVSAAHAPDRRSPIGENALPDPTGYRFVRARAAAEAAERTHFASYATLSVEAGPREHAEPEDPFRTALRRDRDRILHAGAFRALQHKTQVFVVHEGEHVRTRLTHTLEVAQIARSVAGYLGAHEDLAEAIALAHDLGHTPFGHAGEEEISACLTEHGAGRFDHNARSLRIVTELEERAPGLGGLNLTFATREGIARHETAYDRPAAVHQYYVTNQPGIEAQIANLADPLAYTTHDLEDALRLRFFDEEELTELGLRGLDDALAAARAECASLPAVERRLARARGVHRRLLNSFLTALLEETDRRLGNLGAHPTAACVRGAAAPVVAFPATVEAEIEALGAFLHRRVYRHPTVLDMCAKGRRILRGLFEHYLDHPDHLPRRVQARCARALDGPINLRAGAVCDYLAGLTDRGAMDLFRSLFEPYARTLVWLE